MARESGRRRPRTGRLTAAAGRFYVVVSGPPGSGKTTVARGLARELGLPLFSKDTIKETLMDQIDAPDIDTSRSVGRAAIKVMLAVAAESGFGVLESVWRRTVSLPDLSSLPAPIIEVFCRCDPALARSRYRRRAATRSRGHFDEERLADDELWTGESAQPIGGDWPVLEVDTVDTPDVSSLARRIRAHIPERQGGLTT